MKLPKEVIICGKKWTVISDKKISGGHFEGANFKIVIGCKYKQDILDCFLHEVIEVVLEERNHRYKIYRPEKTNGTENYLFSFNHEQFTNIIFDIAYAIKDIIKKEEK